MWRSGQDKNNTTLDILRIVQYYGWDKKIVLALGAFAVKDGENWLVAHLYTMNTRATAVRQLKQVQKKLKAKFDDYNNLVKAMLDMTQCIVQLCKVCRDPYLTPEEKQKVTVSELVSNTIPLDVYTTIFSIVVAARHLLGITGMGPNDFIEEGQDLTNMVCDLKDRFSKRQKILFNLRKTIHALLEINGLMYAEEKKAVQEVEALARALEKPHIDNTKPLRCLFYKDDLSELYDYKKKTVNIDVLKGKVVILFISDLDFIKENEYLIALQMYLEKQQNPTRPESQFEVVWIPIQDTWTNAKYQQFEELRRNMEWYTVFHPSDISQIAIRLIKDPWKWNFVKKPILVVMDYEGKIVHRNAVHMMCVWGSLAFPFTSRRERFLWEEQTWCMELLADAIDQNISTWITEGKYICLYGGDDIEWIRNFTRAAKNVALEDGIQLELVYAGMRNPKEKVREKVLNIIQAEKLSHTLAWNLICLFWIRLESMWISKGQVPSDDLKNDPVMEGITSILNFGSSDRGWAVISLGSADMSTANGEHMLRSLRQYNDWKIRSPEVGFTPALNEHLQGVHIGVHTGAPHRCTLILPATGIMPETLICTHCGRLMERFSLFRCGTD
ncbi:hypothetical protein ACFX19_044549 [Malus domestica]